MFDMTVIVAAVLCYVNVLTAKCTGLQFDAYIQDALLHPQHTPAQRRQSLVDWEQASTCSPTAFNVKLFAVCSIVSHSPAEVFTCAAVIISGAAISSAAAAAAAECSNNEDSQDIFPR